MTYSATAERIERKEAFPLRIFGESGKHYFACPYEYTYDDIVLSHLNEDQRVIHLQADTSPNVNSILAGFKRHFLYSRAAERHVVTASGYLFDGPVELYSWKMRSCPDDVQATELIGIELLKRIELFHVRGDEKNITAGLENAIAEHRRRISGLRLSDLSLVEGDDFFHAMTAHVPRIS